MEIKIQNDTIPLAEVSQLYPAAMIRYADGTVTPISLEWYDSLANRDVTLLHYAICVHFRQKERKPSVYAYPNREALEEGMAELAQQLDPPME